MPWRPEYQQAGQKSSQDACGDQALDAPVLEQGTFALVIHARKVTGEHC